MKAMGLALLFLLLGGCGSYQTLEELERQAFVTGDWSEVNKRERIIAKRRNRMGLACGSGTTQYCESWGASERCTCVSSVSLRDTLDRW